MIFSKKNIILGLILVGIFITGFILSYFLFKSSKTSVVKTINQTPSPSTQTINFAPIPTTLLQEKGVYNTVFLGYGGTGHSGGLLTDSIIVVHVNSNNKTAVLISVPRDLWVDGNHKINADASINGFQNIGGVVKSVTGLPINYFAAVNFSEFTKLIDTVGEITVDVPKSFDDPFYPIAGLENETCGKSVEEIAALKEKYSDAQLEMQFICRYERIHYDKGPANLNGTEALKFVRSRHGDSDFGRSERQFAVLKGILSKLISLQTLTRPGEIITNLLKLVNTNLTFSQIKDLLEIIGDSGIYKITTIHLSTENVLVESRSSGGAYILNPKAGIFNYSEIREYISSKL